MRKFVFSPFIAKTGRKELKQRSGQPELLKEINRKHAFDVLQKDRLLSRPKLAKLIGLSRATVSVLMDELLRTGVAVEEGLGTSTGGRPPVMLKFNPQAAYALGARMRDHTWGIVITDLDARVLHTNNVHIPSDAPQVAVDALCQGVYALMEQVDRSKILPAIGLGTPGLVDIREGTIKTAVDMGWVDVPMGAMVAERLGMEVLVANRSKVGALAEFWHNAERGVRDLIYISLGTGVAAGIVHKGELYVGANSSAGELGHVTILPDGPLCPCGNRGCLQQLVSGPAIANRAREKMRQQRSSLLHGQTGSYPEQVTAEMVFAAAEAGDELALEIVQETAVYLGIAVANLVNLFNPELIVVGGPVGQMSQVLLQPLQEEVRRRAMTYPLSTVDIATSAVGPIAGAVGASVLVLQRASEFLFRKQ